MRPLPRGALRLILLVGVPLLVGAVSVFLWLSGGRYVSTENAYVKADIVQMAAEVSGRIVKVAIRDHARIAKGDLLVEIDPVPYELALKRAEAELDALRQQVATLKASYEEARTELAEARGRSAYFAQQAARNRELARRGVVSSSKLEEIENSASAARDRVAVARKKLERVLASIGGSADVPVDDHPLVREKQALRDRARLDLAKTRIVAPVDGIAVNMKLQPGEQVKAQVALFSIVAAHQAWIEANFKETDLTHVTVGQKATVVLDIYPGVSWQAVVESISPATGAEFAILPPQNASGNWVKVVQRLPVRLRLVERQQGPSLRAGMTATVTIDTERVRHLSDIIGTGDAVAMRRK